MDDRETIPCAFCGRPDVQSCTCQSTNEQIAEYLEDAEDWGEFLSNYDDDTYRELDFNP